MTRDSEVKYSVFFDLCTKAAKRWGSVFDLPVALEPRAYLRKLYRERYPQGSVLDFGCGATKALKRVLRIEDDLYESCDSGGGDVTYEFLDHIPKGKTYDMVSAEQVFEHLSFDDGVATAIKLGRHVAPGGILQIGVPNPQHPTRQLSNPTHITPWEYLNLCALLELSGLDVVFVARSNKKPGPRWYERPFISIVCRVFRMDWCDTVYAVGRRPE